MIIKIQESVHQFKYSSNGMSLIVEPNGRLQFFKDWQKNALNKPARDYKVDIPFETKLEAGIFVGCFPVVSLNEELVTIYYDLKILTK